MKVEAYAAMEPQGKLIPYTYEAGSCAEEEVEVAVTHCGLCHSDVHLIDNDWEVSEYPLIPGHEIVGTISQVGSRVTDLEVGQGVGIGWQCSSCFHCNPCRQGEENLCVKAQGTAVGHFGGFATHARAHRRFVVPMPEALSMATAAPLLCGGITVYSPMHLGKITPNQQLAVVGIGGLGHLALQFYHTFGCEVTAISSSQEKEQETKALGADHFVTAQQLKKREGAFDFILCTAPGSVDCDLYLSLLKPKGKLCIVGVASSLTLNAMSLISGAKHIFGNPIGNPLAISEMLHFASRHQILPQIETFPLSEVNTAIAKLRENKVRYRAVLEI